ncbi:MAG: hypothetical protein KZQ74_02280 [gamma proteobacterium symbiont of Bathyaustriella thionipta]|nr:hypothetical protein [gamma proteobacterium symbiont of Bathyaustriella thionipta]MCU7966022.1 hypothetical protein [gamma proteobacterium symbiont of Bathyaustriella thionipta]
MEVATRLILWVVIAVLFQVNAAHAEIKKHVENILVINGSSHYKEIVEGIRDEVNGNLNIIEVKLKTNKELGCINNKLSQHKPKFIILIGNKASVCYYRYQKRYPEKDMVPAIIVSSLFVGQLVKHMRNTAAIRYETPLPILVSRSRQLIEEPIDKIGVVYRKWMKDFVFGNKNMAHIEDVKLVHYEIENKPSAQSVRYYFKQMAKEDIDAIWLIDDSYIMNPKFIKSSIEPILREFKKPVLASSETFVKKEVALADFSMTPDSYFLGIQTASVMMDILTQIKESNGKANEAIDLHSKPIEPISMVESINMRLINTKGLKMNPNTLLEIETIYE